MNKRIISLMLCFVMILAMLATAVPSLAAGSSSFTITADKAEANPGDTITYTVTMGAVSRLDSLKFKLVIPEGLTIVAGSGTLATGLKDTLKCVDTAWTESTKVFYVTMCDEGTGYSSDNPTVLMTLQCTVDAGASGNLKVDFNINPNDCYDPDYDNIAFTTTPATVKVTAAHTHVYDQEVATEEHLKFGAICTEAAVYYKSCTCGENGTETFTSGDALGHDYSKQLETEDYLKTAASNCTEHNVYWYACSRCDSNAKDDAAATDKYYTSATFGNHSFTEKITDEAHYVAGTGTDCQNVKKYYYDCAYCNQMGTTTWDSTTYGPHNHATTWSSDANGHWHECSLCGDKKDEAKHTPGAEATETTPQTCTECGYVIQEALVHTHNLTKVDAKPATCTEGGNIAYYKCNGCEKLFKDGTGNVETNSESVKIGALGHDYATTWSSDANGHWHECSRCHDKEDEAEHTPGAAATETTPQKCTECGYVIQEALGHTHSLTKVDAKPATCTEGGHIAYYKCNGCEKLFEDGTGNVETNSESVKIGALGHDYATTWSSDANGHWHECSRCHDKEDEATHTFGDWKETKHPTATEKGEKQRTCTICQFIETVEIPAITPIDPTTITMEIPFTKTVKQGGNTAPGKEIFQLEIFDIGNSNTDGYADVTYTASVTTSGKGNFDGVMKITGPADQVEQFICEGFFVREIKGSAANWTYSDTVWYVGYESISSDSTNRPNSDRSVEIEPTFGLVIHPAWLESSDNGNWYNYDYEKHVERMTFENTYTYSVTDEPSHEHSYHLNNDNDYHWQECGCGNMINKEAHIFGEWTVTKEATATEKGEKHHTCTVCQYTEMEEIPTIDGGETVHEHSYSLNNDKDYHWQECDCGNIIDKEAHIFGEWTVIKEATANEKGEKQHTCTVCQYTEMAEIPFTEIIKPEEGNQNTGALDDVPKTGDNSNMILWIVLLLASSFGLTGAVVYSKKKRHAK